MPGLEVKPLLDELRARVAEELDYQLEAASQQAFADAYAGRPGHLRARRGRRHRPRAGQRVDGRHPALQDHQSTAAGRSGTGPGSCSSASCSPARPGPGCCTPTRTRATSGCSPTGGSACWTSAPWTGCPTGCRRSSASCCGSCTTDARHPGPAEQELRRAGLPPGGRQRRPGRAARVPGPAGRAVPGGDVQVQPGVAAGRGGPGDRPALGQRGPAAQPAALLRADPPGVHGRASACCASSSARGRSGPRCSRWMPGYSDADPPGRDEPAADTVRPSPARPPGA